MKKLLLFVAAVLTSATINAQNWEAAPVSSGFNFDAICESPEAAPTQRGPLDTHGSQLVTQDVFGASYYLPSDGNITTDSEHPYKFASYSANNCLVMTKSTAYPTDVECTEGTLTLTTPVQANSLAFLFVTANKENYDMKFSVTPIYTDNSEGTAQEYSLSQDWGQNPSNKVYTCNRWRVTAGTNPEGFQGALQEESFSLDSSKTLKAVKFTYKSDTEDAWGWHYINIFALSVEKNTTGINDVTVDGNNTIEGVYTIDGRQVSEAQHGVNVVKMSNGKAKKVIKK